MDGAPSGRSQRWWWPNPHGSTVPPSLRISRARHFRIFGVSIFWQWPEPRRGPPTEPRPLVRDVEFLRRRITFSENAVQIGARPVGGPTKGRKARPGAVLVLVLDALSAQCREKAPADLMFSSRDGGYL